MIYIWSLTFVDHKFIINDTIIKVIISFLIIFDQNKMTRNITIYRKCNFLKSWDNQTSYGKQ